jgi:tetraacyldisaccharide-1-P 4'-kinase
MAEEVGAEMIITTMKDIVKIKREKIGNIPLYAIEIGIEFLSGENEVRKCVANVLGNDLTVKEIIEEV